MASLVFHRFERSIYFKYVCTHTSTARLQTAAQFRHAQGADHSRENKLTFNSIGNDGQAARLGPYEYCDYVHEACLAQDSVMTIHVITELVLPTCLFLFYRARELVCVCVCV